MQENLLYSKIQSIILEEYKLNKKRNLLYNLTLHDLYRLTSVSILCLLSDEKNFFSYFMSILMKNRNRIPESYSINFSFLQLILIVKIASIKFNDFHDLSNQLMNMLNNRMDRLFKDFNKIEKINFIDSQKGPLPYLSFLLSFQNNLTNYFWYNQLLIYLNSFNIKLDFYKNPIHFDRDRKELFPNGYIDLSRAHGLTGLISLLNKLKLKDNEFQLSDFQLQQYDEILKEALVIKNDNYLWSPFLVRDNNNNLVNNSAYNILKSQQYCWCSGSYGMNSSIYSFSNVFNLQEINQAASKVFSKENNSIVLSSDNYFICHGYAGVYLLLNNQDKTINKNINKYLENKLLDYIDNINFDNFKDYLMIDGAMSILYALLLTRESNKKIKEHFYTYFMFD